MVRTDFGELQEKYWCVQGGEGGAKHEAKCDLRDSGMGVGGQAASTL